MSNKIWEIIGKISLLATTIATIIGIYVFMNQAQEKLELHLETYPYSIDPLLKNSIVRHSNKYISEIEKKLNTIKINSEEDKTELLKIIKETHSQYYYNVSSNIENFKGLNYLLVSNTGNKIIKNIKINLPAKGIAIITYPDESQKFIKFNKVIPIKDIRAGNQVILTVWTVNPLGRFFNKDKINITYQNGLGIIDWDNTKDFYWSEIDQYFTKTE